jgi:hypothetical protein
LASNFKVSIHRNDNSLYLTLGGDFDGTSAYDLLRVLENHSHGATRIFIHTHGLKKIHPFGLDILRRGLSDKEREPVRVVCTGDYGAHLTTEATS